MEFQQRKQRGIYSEVLAPEETAILQQSATSGPMTSLTTRPTQKLPRARGLGRKKPGEGQEMSTESRQSSGIYTMKREGVADVNPKVFEPFAPIPGRAPRKVVIDRKKKRYASIDIEELLREFGVDYTRPSEAWLDLVSFDDCDYEERNNEEWVLLGKWNGEVEAIPGLGLQKDMHDPSIAHWKPVLISGYDVEKKLFQGIWDDASKAPVELPKIHLLFKGEDPYLFANRVQSAHQQRQWTESLIKYNYYIDNMPSEEIHQLDSDQKARLVHKATKVRGMNINVNPENHPLMVDVNQDFTRTMNKIIFDKFMTMTDQSLIQSNLNLPPPPPPEPVPEYAMVQIPNHDFPEQFSNFCFNSLYIKEEVIASLESIREQCILTTEKEIFDTSFKSTMRLDTFKQVQSGAISQLALHLNQWKDNVEAIINSSFADVGKGWFNLHENAKETYEFGKLKKYLTMVKLMMQDAMFSLTFKSCNSFVNQLNNFIPSQVEISGPKEVSNTFELTEEQLEIDPEYARNNPPIPLIALDILQGGKMFQYGQDPSQVVEKMRAILKEGLQKIENIHSIEEVVMHHLFKKQDGKTPLKVPILPVEKPIPPTPEEKRKGKLPDENMWVWELRDKLTELMEKAIKPLYTYLSVYDKYESVMNLKPEDYIKDLEDDDAEPWTVEQVQEEILKHQQLEKEILDEIPETIRVSMFEVHCKDVRNALSRKHFNYAKTLIELIAQRARNTTVTMLEEFRKLHREINKPPANIEELTEIKDLIARVPIEVDRMRQEIDKNMNTFSVLESFGYKFTNADLDKKWDLFGFPKHTLDIVTVKNDELDKQKVLFQEQMLQEQEDFEDAIQDLESIVTSFITNTDINQYKEVAEMVQRVNDRLTECTDKAKKYNHHEYLFGLETTDYSRVHQAVKDFKPFSDLWLTIDKWYDRHEHWMTDEWEMLDGREIEDTVENSVKTISGVYRIFNSKEDKSMMPVVSKIKEDVDYFRQYVKLAVSLRKPGMCDRHWDQITQHVGFEVRPHEGFTLTTVIEMGLKKFEDFIEEVGERAYKEHQIETKLNEMEKAWEDVAFDVLPAKGTDTWILGGLEPVQNLLDEHIMQTQNFYFSAFKKPFEDRIEEWIRTLMLVQDIIEAWFQTQINWMYLNPIFDSKDIMKQLPNETKKFRSVDGTWRHTMGQVKQNSNVIKTCKKEGRLEALREANRTLEAVQKELKNYLETKRSAFSRFYFLSDEELLSILSDTKDPTLVQHHLRKVFENMQALEFQEDFTITAMLSAEGERVAFVNIIDPREKGVEHWMSEIEKMMQISVRWVLKVSIDDYLVRDRNDWILNHPGQCVLNGSQVHWTSEVEQAIEKGNEGLAEYYQYGRDQLLKTVSLVRGELTALQSISIGALIVIDVHANDVIQRLIDNNVETVEDFDWIAQLRYYWEDDDCYVKCIQTSYPYGYEYLGNTGRLVITELTDKCYMTLMGALHLSLGGAPAGPAGTGKTESTKDLSKALAKPIVVFNCSGDMDHIMVATFFKGLASTGAWACFDEFNRINVEVLSVVAQQLQTLLERKRAQDYEFEFEGSVIYMKPTFSVFITMNPGYAGRTELPDNLKALFRSVAMMVPDYAVIGEIKLYSFGFEHARDLAKKMVATFKLSSEQLSSQGHYDYGMRAVSSVINAAGLIKRQEPDLDEYKLLLRALRDVNVPKFLRDDIPLFENIILDLFPGVEKPNIDRSPLDEYILKSCDKLNLQRQDAFIGKVIQLYDTIQVRHGLMLVGPTGGGKTSNYRVLSQAITALKHLPRFDDVSVHILNPKSITMGQLYGKFDEMTHEWSDGILANLIRRCVNDMQNPPYTNKHWVMFDGPVDSLWIESMNTVLDDNKKLCLNSGEIIKLTPHIVMMFEVEDLYWASPATVSRCGMVYMEPVTLGLQPLVKSWLNTIPEKVMAHPGMNQKIEELFEYYAYPMIDFVRRNLSEIVKSMDNNLLQSIARLLMCHLVQYNDSEIKVVQPEEIQELFDYLENIFIYCTIWALGVTTNNEGRRKFDRQMRSLIMNRSLPVSFPDTETVYEWHFDFKEKEYHLWTKFAESYQVDNNLNFNEIVVPTMESIRLKYAYKLLLTNKYHVLSPGPTGTGKSVNSESLLTSEMPSNFQYISMTFSAKTTANQTQDFIDSKMTRRKNREYGPGAGKYFVIFVDDLNMPKREQYWAQPPIELLRQWMDHKGWYNRKDLIKIDIVDIVFLAAMGPPGGGRTEITNRIVRHFNIMTYINLEETDITQIYSKILGAILSPYVEPIQKAVPQLVASTIEVYNIVEQNLLPTPKKSHYTFNLRDMASVFQGVCSSDQRSIPNILTMVKLWCHENLRVFGDRLMTQEDIDWLNGIISEKIEQYFSMPAKQVFEREKLIFANFLNSNMPDDQRAYEEVTDTQELMNIVNEYLDNYNERYPKKQMKLVIFLDACCHVARICRILKQPQGNALLLGVGGSGRQSLTKLSAYIIETELKQIEITKSYNMVQWRDDIKAVLKYAGIKNERVIFMFVDTQIIDEQMLEDVNNILNSADVPNIYNKGDDWEDIESVGKPECQRRNMQLTEMNIMSQYLARVKKNIRIVIAMSPIGEQFKSNLRMFPSLINCCTIDWFTDWPEEALISVARGQLAEDDLNLGDQFERLVMMFKLIHKSVEVESNKFLHELRRYNYVTPTSYLELLRCFKNLLTQKRIEIQNQRSRFQGGVSQLQKAAQMVEEMSRDLEAMRPELAKSVEEAEKMMEQIAIDNASAEETQKSVAKDEAEAQEKTDEVTRLTNQAQKELDEAIPLLNAALESLKQLKKDDFVEVRTFTVPPKGVILTMQVLCYFFGVRPAKINDPNRMGAKIDSYWEPAKAELLKNPNELLERLKGYDKEAITEDLISKLRPFIEDDDFQPHIVKNASKACEAMCKWAHAMYRFYHVNKQVEPVRQKVRELREELAITTEQLNKAKARLKEVTDKLDNLQRMREETLQKQEQLIERINDCEIKKERADKLIGGLGGESERWNSQVADLSAKLELLPGDCALSAGMVAYSGPFTRPYRQKLEADWLRELVVKNILHTDDVNMRLTLGDPVAMQQWKVAGLPSDPVSVENGIIIEKARRWPLMIDPQMQANNFVKKLGKEHEEGIEFCKASDANLIRLLGQAVMNGKWFLVENVGTELDPSLDPILNQQIVKEGAGYTIRIGEKNVEYNRSFKFFMTTTLPNPHYSPETCVKVTLLNFAITPEGLEEQMMARVVAKENAQLEETKSNLIAQKARAERDLKAIEDQILEQLSNTEGNILENQELIDTLSASKQTSTNLMHKVEEAKHTEAEIDAARESYRPVAFRAQLLFFCIMDLQVVKPTYQYSLQWFIKLFELGIDNSPSPGGLDERLQSLNSYFTYSLYQNVCRSLFEVDKLLFSFTLTIKILQGYNEIDPIEWRFLLTGPQDNPTIPPNPTTWLNDNQWSQIYKEVHAIDALHNFQGFEHFFLTNIDEFKKIFDSNDSHQMPLPGEWDNKLNEFQKLIVLRSIRPDKIVDGVMQWITLKMDRKFIIPPTFDLPAIFKDSSVTTPLICILSPGSDPISAILRFAEEVGMAKKLDSISLGSGMGDRASQYIEDAKTRGGWVLLQNCHLYLSWMHQLERIVEEFDDSIHREFRLWLTTNAIPQFPVSVLQNGVKMTIEPPTGLRANLLLSYSKIDDKDLDACAKVDEYKTLYFSFCFFHAIVQDRRKFGPIGWNIPYEFTNEDLDVTLQQLKIFLDDEAKPVPYKVLNILGAKINYGGRVTDYLDIRLIETILRTYICPEVFEESYKFSESGTYFCIAPGKKDDYVKYIEELPLNPSPEAFGLNQNAQITTAQNETLQLLGNILKIQPRSATGATKSTEEVIGEMAQKLEKEMPADFDVEDVGNRYQTQYGESMNTVLLQEVIKYQRLLDVMKTTLSEVQKALVGRIVMSEELELMSESLFNNMVPQSWEDIGFLSLKPLASWFEDLMERVKFLKDWIDGGTPKVFWISGFFFPQAFITGTLQNFARKHIIAIDLLDFDYVVTDYHTADEISSKPEDGCYVTGLWLEGARWDKQSHCLKPSHPKELYTQLPIMHFIPRKNRFQPETGIYKCPMYKVLSRRGTLSTTGHSTNFVLMIELPSKEEQDVWIKAGVAVFLALRN